MKSARRPGLTVPPLIGLTTALSLVASLDGGAVRAQVLPNPYRIVDGWAQLPNGRPMGAVGKAAIDRDGRHIWAVVGASALADPARFGDECRDSKTDSVYKFGPDGKVVASFGGGMFIWPHGLGDRSGRQRLGHRCGRRQPDAEGRQARAAGRQVQPRRQGADHARHTRALPGAAPTTSTRRATSSSRRTARCSSPTATTRTATTAS